MIRHTQHSDAAIRRFIRHGTATVAANTRLKIFGLLSCRSGKRMKRDNRVFFVNAAEAIANGFRPCAHCLSTDYKVWKKNRAYE